MFSRIYQSARALLTEPTQKPSSKPPTGVPNDDDSLTMVTSRSQSRAARGEDAATPNSSGKKRRLRSAVDTEGVEDEEEVATPSAAKKRKTLPVREKGSSPIAKKSVPVVEIPARDVTPAVEASAGSPAKPIEIEDDEESSVEDVIQGEEEKVEEPQKVDIDTKTTHKRFGSEEAEQEVFSTAKEIPETVGEVADSEEDSESEDDAPETIGIQEAAKEIKLKERDTAKAVKEQQSASRKKRKERDEVLKKQSEKGKKRKSVATKSNPEEASSDPEEEPTAVGNEFTSRALTSRSTLPSFLPAEYLEDTDPQEVVRTEDDDDVPRKEAKKTKFIDASLKAPKDCRVGKTTYRVAKAGSTQLAPKSSFTARSTKEAWLQGRSGGKIDPNRRAFGKAFGRR